MKKKLSNNSMVNGEIFRFRSLQIFPPEAKAILCLFGAFFGNSKTANPRILKFQLKLTLNKAIIKN